MKYRMKVFLPFLLKMNDINGVLLKTANSELHKILERQSDL